MNTPQSTLSNMTYCLGYFVKYLSEQSINSWKQINQATIKKYQHYMTLCGYSRATQKNQIYYVKGLLSFLYEKGIISTDLASAFQTPKAVESLPKNVLTISEVEQILQCPDLSSAKGIRDRALLEVIYSSGLRLKELANLKIDHVDLDQGLLIVVQGKGAKDRITPIGEVAVKYLSRYINMTRKNWCSKQPTQYALWLSSRFDHLPLTTDALARCIRDIAKQALSKTVSPHAFRHACATHMLNSGASVHHVQKQLGHKSITSTQVYTHLSINDLKQTLSKTHPRK